MEIEISFISISLLLHLSYAIKIAQLLNMQHAGKKILRRVCVNLA